MHSKTLILCILLIGCAMIASAQVKFAEGYIVNNKNEKTYCLIRNVGQEESTAKYQYKLKNEKEIHDMELSKIAEFGIENEMKCIRELIAVDMASETIKNVNDTATSWMEGHAYIKLLVEGELATLYSNYDHGRPLFFYSYGNSPVEPLVYKKFSVEVAPNVVSQYIYNNTYVQQLEDNLSCGTPVESRKISYSKKDIVNYFIDFHKCKGADYTVYQSSQNKKGSVRFKIGANYNILQAAVEEFSDALPNAVFSKENTLGFSAELEYLFSFNKYKWGLFAEANYYKYFTDKTDNISYETEYLGYVIDYKTIEFPVGITHYMNLDEKNRLFVRAAFVPHIILEGSHIEFSDVYHSEFSTASRLFFGGGYNYDRLAAEFRYYTKQNITMNIFKRSSELTQFSFRLSYTLFRTVK
ncbi:MAG: hypothetical protein GX102_12025 [Porphyromonadaceae bacterium]|nr:hypothetical protein [Porphyromonadaceae bacterium]